MNMNKVNLGFALKTHSVVTQLVVDELKTYRNAGLSIDQVIEELSAQVTIVPVATTVNPRKVGRPLGSAKPVAATAGFLTIKELSKIINVSTFTIYGWATSNLIKTHKIEGVKYVQPSEINPFLSSKGLPLLTPETTPTVTR